MEHRSVTVEPIEMVYAGEEYNQSGLYTITGLVKNTSPDRYRFVFAKFTLYDKNGRHVGNAADVTSDLEPLRSWKFKAISPIPSSQVFSYELSELRYRK